MMRHRQAWRCMDHSKGPSSGNGLTVPATRLVPIAECKLLIRECVHGSNLSSVAQALRILQSPCSTAVMSRCIVFAFISTEVDAFAICTVNLKSSSVASSVALHLITKLAAMQVALHCPSMQ